MFDLQWSWLCIPYVVCTVSLAAIGVVAALVRGDRVLRLGVIGAAMTALPWAICSTLAICTDDPAAALRLLRLGSGPISMIGPNLLLVLLGLSGQLERHRWAARTAGVVGATLLVLCWTTDWTVPGVRRLSSGVYYVTAGPLTDFHISQMAMWLVVGLVIARRSMMRGERRKMMRVVVAAVVLAAVGGTDVLLIHGVLGVYPIAWLPATIACIITLHLELHTDLLRPRGIDRRVVLELAGFAAAAVVVGAVAYLLEAGAPVAVAALGSAVWITGIAIMWGLGRRRPPPRVFGERALARFVAGLTDLDDDRRIAAGLAALWQQIAVGVRTIWRADPDQPGALADIASGAAWSLDPEVCGWLAAYGEPLAAADLTTMRLGPIRPKVEAAVVAHDATLIVPLIDRGTLVGLVEADHERALREAERGLVAGSARAAARALTYVHLAQIAAREGATAREVEVAEAMRLQASASRDDALGPWRVTAAYRSAPRTTGAAWSASLYGDGRLALLVTEGQARGVVAALATAALTGAFTAATGATPAPALDELIALLGASAEAVRRGGEPIAAFVAIVDRDARQLAWACAGHPGALVVEPGGGASALGGGGARLGDPHGAAQRGTAAFEPDALLVVGSRGVRPGAPDARPGVPGARPEAWIEARPEAWIE
ncbi:MAG TPA: SpoIIE family protein phosphatase, partial [Kofleriaceae bacterium]|nr:SpoIIE family protein phosphatase [Kofleriaceae bacterium]